LGLFIISPTAGQDQGPAENPAEAATFSRGVLIELQGMITPMKEQYLYRKLEAANAKNADLVIIEIDSPGGYLEQSLSIARHLRSLHWAHTVAYVPHEALSGAAIAALGCDEIIMSPRARFGDAGPIFLDEDFLFRHAPEKIRSDLALQVRDLAEATGRPPALAEAMVDMDLVVYRVENRDTGEVTFKSDHELESDTDRDDWEKLEPVLETRKNHFLEVNGERAVELDLAEGLASSREQLRRHYQLEAEFLVLKSGGVDTAVYILNLPLVTGLLFVIGLIALYVELSAPGLSVGGLIAGLCFTLFFWSRFLGGTSTWLEVLLFLAGVVFLGVEVFVLPGFGVAGVAGLLLILASVILASQEFVIPNTERQLETLAGTLLVVAGSGVAFVIAAAVLSRYFGSIPLFNKLVLQPPNANAHHALDPKQAKTSGAALSPIGGHAVHVGDWGIAISPLRPAGKVRFNDDYVDVVTEGSFVDSGRQVRIIDISGNRIVVREIDEPTK
jgi:membrane-bound serine protease (ClpP class)